MSECGDRKLTMLGFDAVCSKPQGHDGNHESADFVWLPEMNWAAAK